MNKVLAGDYLGYQVAYFGKLMLVGKDKVLLDSSTILEYSIRDSVPYRASGRTFLRSFFLGLFSEKAVYASELAPIVRYKYYVDVHFIDGSISMLLIDEKLYEIFLKNCSSIKNTIDWSNVRDITEDLK